MFIEFDERIEFDSDASRVFYARLIDGLLSERSKQRLQAGEQVALDIFSEAGTVRLMLEGMTCSASAT